MKNHSLKFKTELNKRVYHYAIQVLKFIKTLPKDDSIKIITDQLLRSATSIGANMIEAQASSSKKDFINFFHHSLKSANESAYWLGLLKDAHEIQNFMLDNLLQETEEIGNILGASLLTLKGRRKTF